MQRMLRKNHLDSMGNRFLKLRTTVFLSSKMMILRMTVGSFDIFFPCTFLVPHLSIKKLITEVTLLDAKDMAVNKTA